MKTGFIDEAELYMKLANKTSSTENGKFILCRKFYLLLNGKNDISKGLLIENNGIYSKIHLYNYT